MTYRIVIFLWRKPTLTPAQFKEHYDTKHLPLVRSLVGDAVFFRKHARHYVTTDGGAVLRKPAVASAARTTAEGSQDSDRGDALSYDVVVEAEFDDEQHYRSFVDAVFNTSEETKRAVEEDEERFLRRDMTTVLAVGDSTVFAK